MSCHVNWGLCALYLFNLLTGVAIGTKLRRRPRWTDAVMLFGIGCITDFIALKLRLTG